MELKKILSAMLAGAVLAGTALVGVQAEAPLPFTDVKTNAWYTNSVREVYNESIMLGKSDTVFDPSGTVSRAEFVTVMSRLACVNASKGNYGESLTFSDTKTDAWYSGYVGWAVETGLTTGFTDNTFRPSQAVTRQEMAVFINRLVNYLGENLPDNAQVSSFKDADKVGKFAKEAVEAMRKSGIIKGDQNGNFNPLATADRASVATIAERLFSVIDTTKLVDNGKSDYVIVAGEENTGAAERIQYQLEYTMGVQLDIVESSSSDKAIILGGGKADTKDMINDAYEITVDGETVYIDGATAEGIYKGAVRFMNDHTFGTTLKYTDNASERYDHEYPIGKLTINGNDISKYTIYYPENASKTTLTAVDDLVKYIEMACGAKLPTSTEKAGSYGIIVDETTVVVKDSVNKNEDNFTVKSEGNSIRLKGSAARGAAYACYDFLEYSVGCVFLTSKQDYIQPADEIDIKGLDYTESPIFAIRDNYGNVPGTKFRDYAWSTANGIHTFAALAPDFCKQYDNQPCLLDEAVYEQMIGNALKKLEAKPQSQLISFSMNDNTTWCECDKCTAFMESVDNNRSEYVIRFVNRAAEAIEKAGYTDVLVHTFSYADAVEAPQTKPRDNVIIQFCPIQACIAHPVTDDCNTGPFGQYIGKYLRDWSEVGCKIYLWTYHGNFSNSPVPHTDISARTMLTNARYYADCGTIGWFGQINNRNPDVLGDFGAMRNYLLSKVMWDPYMTEEEYNDHLTKFMKGYYGDAWELIYEVMNTYIAADIGHHMLFAPVQDRILFFTYKMDIGYLTGLFDVAELSAESETIWRNIDRNQLSFNMMDVSVKWRSLYASGTDEDVAKAQSLAKWFQDKLLVYKVSYGAESDMFPNMVLGEFPDPANWRGELNCNTEIQQYWGKIEQITVEYPDYPTDLLPY